MSALRSPPLRCPLELATSFSSFTKSPTPRRFPPSYPPIRAIELDQNTVAAITVGIVSTAVGVGIPVFMRPRSVMLPRERTHSLCFPCGGSGARTRSFGLLERCRFCLGTGRVAVELGGDEKEVSRCINCDGTGSLTCTTCQPRYLDLREFKDDD